MSAKPLHVQAAEALGWQHCSLKPVEDHGKVWIGLDPLDGQLRLVPRLDRDWSVGGPLIHRFKLRILPMQPNEGGVPIAGTDWRWQVTPYQGRRWWSGSGGDVDFSAGPAIEELGEHADRDEQNRARFLEAESELEGVCWLVIAMGRAGWLAQPPGGLNP